MTKSELLAKLDATMIPSDLQTTLWEARHMIANTDYEREQIQNSLIAAEARLAKILKHQYRGRFFLGVAAAFLLVLFVFGVAPNVPADKMLPHMASFGIAVFFVAYILIFIVVMSVGLSKWDEPKAEPK